ncbi:MAG: diguanylate cyclase [Woeseiaceae bacterium]|nr:diguanylate cyclase [Woeseiaceae bacterium]
MKAVKREVLEQVIDASAEPVMVVNLDQSDWPVVLANAAFGDIGDRKVLGVPFADVIEALVGRDLALDISETFRERQETSFPVEVRGVEYVLTLKPVKVSGDDGAHYYAVYWRGTGAGAVAAESHNALLRAKRTIRDLTREDPVTGLLNERAFRDVLDHDWAVAAREKNTLALVVFELDDFDAYVEVFGRHASDSCRRRVGQAVRRCLRRASDVVASLDSARFIVLSHASSESGVREFADRISTAVRELGLHHPRSTHGRFVTVSQRVAGVVAGKDLDSAAAFLAKVLDDSAAD